MTVFLSAGLGAAVSLALLAWSTDALAKWELRLYSEQDLTKPSDRRLLRMHLRTETLWFMGCQAGVVKGPVTRRLNTLDRLVAEQLRALVA